ncbi:MAG: hypothetical protein U9O94_03720 [Nanoarchaeota archaeon]|nr:hypothetical protein [Nanoarchaeota archaeon]
MKKNKKSAIEASTLVLYIVLVASGLTLGGAVYYFVSEAQDKIGKEACKFDITKAALSKEFPDRSKLLTAGHRITSLKNCRRDKLPDLVIKYDDVVEKGLINQDMASRIIANEMAACWRMVGKGDIDPFSNWDNDDTSYCMICSTIKFDEKLQNYYIESLSDEKLAQKRGGDGVISSPIPWMIDNDYKNGKSYYDFIYKSKAEFTDNELEDMGNYFVTEDTAIMLKLYKFEDKDMAEVIFSWGFIVVGALITVIGILISLSGVGVIIGVPLSSIGGKILIGGVFIAVAGTAATLIGGGVAAGVLMFDPININPFSECEDCNGVGSIKVIPPQFDIAQEIEIEYKIQDKESIIEKGQYCEVIVN